MDKFFYWMKKLGIMRTAVYTAKGDAKKMVDMQIKSELYQSDKEIEDEHNKKIKNKKVKLVEDGKVEPTEKNNKKTIGKIIFWIFVVIGLFFLLAFWGAGWSFWTIIGLLMWGFFLRWTWIHVSSGFLALGKIFVFGAVVIFFSLIFTTPNEEGMGVSLEIEKTGKDSSDKKDSPASELAEGVTEDTVVEFLLELKKETKFDFSKIENDEVLWPAERIKLKLNKAKSFVVEDLSAKDFDKLQKYFLDLGADEGGIGFTFVPPVGTQSAGFSLREGEYSGMMCVLMGTESDGVWIGCGWGPSNNPNSK